MEHGQIRLSIPTTVAPRYGDAKKVGKLKQPASVDVAEDVVHPLSIQLEVAGAMGKLPIHCPSHTMQVHAKDDVTTLSLFGEAFLDRDVVLLIDEVPQQQVATLTQDGEEFPALLSITPTLSADAAASACEIQLKVLVAQSSQRECLAYEMNEGPKEHRGLRASDKAHCRRDLQSPAALR